MPPGSVIRLQNLPKSSPQWLLEFIVSSDGWLPRTAIRSFRRTTSPPLTTAMPVPGSFHNMRKATVDGCPAEQFARSLDRRHKFRRIAWTAGNFADSKLLSRDGAYRLN